MSSKTKIRSYVRAWSEPLLLLAVAGLAVLSTIHLPEPIVHRMLETDIRNEAQLWKRRVVDHVAGREAAFVTGQVTAEDARFLETLTQTSQVHRFNLFSRDGRIFWSSRPEEVGSIHDETYFDTHVLRGQVVYLHRPAPASEIDDFELHALSVDQGLMRDVAEVYVPVVKDGTVVGAMEFNSDITDMRDVFVTRVQAVIAGVSAVALGLLCIIVLVVKRANRRQVALLNEKSRQQTDNMDAQIQLAREVRLLGELNEWLQSSRSLDELFDMVARFMTHMLPECEGSVYVYSNSRDVLDGAVSWNGGSHKDHIHPEECWGLRRGRTYTYGNSEVDFACEHTDPDDKRPYFCFPILAHGETVGLMHLRSREMLAIEDFRPNQRLAQMCAEQISLAIANVQMRDQLHERSVRDPLTGLFNRRHMTDYLRNLITRAQKAETVFSTIYVDVDHFKKFNDNHGHDAGDMVLRAVGEVLDRACDGDEIACRMGGEEFMLILPDVARDAAISRANKLRKAVEAITVRYGEKNLPRITISAGLAIYPEHGAMPQDLLRMSDEALYQAKARGRNQVVVAETNPRTDAPPPSGDAPGIEAQADSDFAAAAKAKPKRRAS